MVVGIFGQLKPKKYLKVNIVIIITNMNVVNNKIDKQLKKAVFIIPKTHLVPQEFLALIAGIKPVILHALSPDEIKLIKTNFSEVKIAYNDKNIFDIPQKDLLTCALSKNELLSKKTLNTYFLDGKGVFKLMGELLSYPKCCVENYIKYFDLHQQWDSSLITYQAYKASKKFNFLVNNLLNFNTRISNKDFNNFQRYQSLNKNFPILYSQFISHIPCRYDCPESIKIGQEIDSLLKEYAPNIEEIVRYTLSKPILFFDLFKLIIFDGYVKEGVLYYQKIIPPFFLIDNSLMDTLKSGNQIMVNDKEIKIFKDNLLLFTYQKKNVRDGFILDFSEE